MILLFYDKLTKTKIPAVYILTNNKYINSYVKIFDKVKNIITLENTINLNWKSISIDFESALIESIKKVFNNIRIVGCMFHYIKNIRLNALKFGLFTKINEVITDNLIKDLSIIPYKYYINNNIINSIFENYECKYNDDTIKYNFNKFKNYFMKNWEYHFKNGILNYKNINRLQRTNSYIENYNKRIREILGPYVYKIGISVIPWPLFLSFIIYEENFYRNKLVDLDSKDLPIEVYDINNDNHEENINENKIFWFNNINFSCRYDSFIFVFYFQICDYIKNNIPKNLWNNEINSIIELCSKIDFNNSDVFKKGFWNFCYNNFENSLNILDDNFGVRQLYHIQSIFTWFNNNPIFCFKYKEIEKCMLCKINNIKIKFSNSYISIDINEINYDKLEDIVYNKFNTNISACENCSYVKNDYQKAIDIKAGQLYKTCFTKTMTDIELPYILSFIFELTNLNDNTDNTQHNNLQKFSDIYIKLIKEKLFLFNEYYELIGIIFMPSVNHYSALVYNTTNVNLNILNKTIYNDDTENNSQMVFIDFENFDNLIYKLKDKYIYLVLYKKI